MKHRCSWRMNCTLAVLLLGLSVLSGCGLSRLSRDELLTGINAGTLPPITPQSTLVERSSFFSTRTIVLQDRITELRTECGEAVLAKVRSSRGFPAGENISRTYLDHESIEVLGKEAAETQGRVRYRIAADGGRGASFGPCANMREKLLIDNKPVIDGPYQYCQQLKK